jgi:hypothetical protein
MPKMGAALQTEGTTYFEGDLSIANETAFRELFTMATQIIKAAVGNIINQLIPLPRYLLEKCCSDTLSHHANKQDDRYELHDHAVGTCQHCQLDSSPCPK